MKSLFSFEGRIDRLPYLAASVAALLSQHAVAYLAAKALGRPPELDVGFWIAPLRSLVERAGMSDAALILAFAYFLVVAFVLASLAFRRARDARVAEGLAAFAMLPLAQFPAILALAIMPTRESGTDSTFPRVAEGRYPAAVIGVVAGIAVTLAAVAVSTLVFGVYGYGLFLGAPFVIGITTGYFANRHEDIGPGRTAKRVLMATALGGVGLVFAALEGVICIVLASPLAAGVALLGGVAGQAIAQSTRSPARAMMPGFALLPVMFALEHLFAVPTGFDTQQAIAVSAPPPAVWEAILRMERIEEPLPLPFRFGVAYPVRGEVIGEGVGAVRRGEFSTGIAIERVTEWEAGRKLAFVVEKDIPAMRELSPYEHVHAPHAVGYFTTRLTSFELVPRGDTTEVVLRSAHEIRLDPILYWMPMARWMVSANNARVLAHIKRQAERTKTAEQRD